MTYNKIYAVIGEERHITLDPVNYQYDIKQILVIQGETVPDYYEADVCNVGDTATLTMIGTAADGVEIPDKFLLDGRNVLVYVVIPGSGGDVQTRYDITIPVDERAEREDIDPSEAEQQQIDSLINALNSGVGRAETAATAAEESATDAEGSAGEAEDQAENAEAWAVGKRAGTDVETEDPTYHNNSKYYAGMAEAAAEEAGQHEASWESWARRAEDAAGNAEESATAAGQSKTDAEAAAQTATQKATEAGNSAAAAAGSAASARQTVDGAIGAINEAKEGAVTQIGSAGSNAVASVNQAGTTQTGRVTNEGNTQVNRVQTKGDEVLDSIPQDYSDLVDDVADLTRHLNAISFISKNIYNAEADVQGSLSDTDGSETESTTRKRSIPIYFNGKKISLARATQSDDLQGAYKVLVYNSDGSKSRVLQYAVGTATSTTITPQSDETYIRIVSSINAEPYMVNYGESLLNYSPYNYKEILNDVNLPQLENYASKNEINSINAELTSVNNDISNLKNETNVINEGMTQLYHRTKNIYNASLDVLGSLRNADGVEIDNDAYKRSPIIYFNGNNITLSKATATDTLHGAFKVAVYNQDGTFSRMLQYASGSAVTTTITPVKDNTRDEQYIRIVSLKNAVQYMVNYGDTLLDYEIPEDRFIFSSECDFVASMHRLDSHYDPITYKGLDGRSGSEPDFNYNTVTAALLYAKIDAVMAEFPDYITKTLLGYDQSGEFPIYEYDLFPSKPNIAFQEGNTYNGGKDYPTVLITSGMHGYGAFGDPPLMPYVIYNFIYDICHNWKQNEVLAYYRQKVKLAIIPISNPWGFNNKSRTNSRGVDINRNFDYNWAAGEPGSTNYGGTEPFSEAETKILRDFIEKYPTAICHTDFHSTGPQNQNRLLYVSINAKSELYYTVYDYISEMSRYWDNDNLPGWEDIEYHGRVVVNITGIKAWTEMVRQIPSVVVESFMNYEGSGYTTDLNDIIVKMAYEQLVCWLSHLIRYRVTMLNPYK